MWRAAVLAMLCFAFSQAHAQIRTSTLCSTGGWPATYFTVTGNPAYAYSNSAAGIDALLFFDYFGSATNGGSGNMMVFRYTGSPHTAPDATFKEPGVKCDASHTFAILTKAEHNMLIDAALVSAQLAEMKDMATVGGAGFSMLMGFIMGYRAAQKSSSQ